MMLRLGFYILLAISVLAISACAPNGVSMQGKQQASQSPPNALALTFADLAGQWKSPCDPVADYSVSAQDLLTFSSNQLTVKTTEFANMNCGGSGQFVTLIKATYTLNGVNAAVPTATNFSMAISEITMTATTASSVSESNTTSYCGYSDWQLNVPKVIALNNTCLDGFVRPYDDILSIAGSTLYFGNENRTALDTSFVYSKQ